MTNYKRFTMKFKPGVYHLLCLNGPIGRHKCKIDDCKFALANRLGELEDKIESGELVLKKEVLKEFAEKLKNVIHERDYVRGYAEIGLVEEIDELLKEYEQ